MTKTMDSRSPRETVAGLARRFSADERATTAVEYAVLALIGLAVIVIVSEIGGTVSGMYEKLAGKLGN
jgi:Flp pilus assembly pilin Flp